MPGRPGEGRPGDFSSGDFGFGGNIMVQKYIVLHAKRVGSAYWLPRKQHVSGRQLGLHFPYIKSVVYIVVFKNWLHAFQDQDREDQIAQDKECQIGQEDQDRVEIFQVVILDLEVCIYKGTY